MADLNFFKDVTAVLILSSALALHTAAAACGFFIKNQKKSKILNTGLTSLNIFLHIFLLGFMMYKSIPLEEAVLVMMISVFFHTLLYFIYHSASEYKKKKLKTQAGGEKE